MNPHRVFHAGLAAACLGLLGFGYYLQFARGLEPCPLCILQRLAFAAVAAIAVIAALHGAPGIWRKVYGAMIAVTALAGGGVAARQVWLQHLPPEQVPECGPGLDYMLQVFPWTDVLRKVLTGSGECAEPGWRFLTLSIAEWSLLWFCGLAACAILHIIFGGRMQTLDRQAENAVSATNEV